MRDPPPISFIPTDSTKPFPMAALETAPAGLLPFTQLKRAQEDLTLRHLHHHQLQHHGQQKKQKMVGVINYGGGRSFDDDDEDDSWEVRAFAEDTSSTMGTTWPPRFYACSFCRREFRSAQALGGHMNVHRRDRARAHLQPRPPPSQAIIPEAAAAAAPCFVFPVDAGGRGFPSTMGSSSSTLFSLSSSRASIAGQASDFSLLAKVGSSRTMSEEQSADGEPLVAEELDLELRLGW